MARAPLDIESLDFENMSDVQLREIMQRAQEMLRERITRRLDDFRLLAREAGFEVTLTKIGERESQRGRRRSHDGAENDDRRKDVPAKYRNPDNTAETWAGRGRKPKWIEEKLAQGRTLDDLLISRSGAAENAG